MRALRLLVGGAAAALTAGAVAVTLARLLQPGTGLGLRLVALTAPALAVYAVVVLLVVVPALRRRGVWLLGLAVALAGVALHAWWVAPLYVGAAPTPAEGAERFVVMSANVEGVTGAEARGVVAAADERGVDVLALVEVAPDTLASMDAAGLAAAYPHRVGGGGDGASGTVLLSRTPLGPVTPLSGVDGLVADVALDGRSVRTLVAHPVQPVADPAGWRRGHEAVLAAADDADLLLGDLNATVDHEPLQDLADAGLRDATERANGGWQPTWPTDGEGLRLPFPLVQIDHVLVGERLTALGTHTVRLEGADHAAIVAELSFT